MAHSHSHSMSMEPWLTQPVMLHSSREYSCSLNPTEQCEYQVGYWRFWYELDHRYALPTVALFMSTIILFSIPFLFANSVPGSRSQSKFARKLLAINRYVSYKSFRISKLNWNSAPLGVLFLGAVGTIFFFAMTLGPRPYYWPNEKDPETGAVTLSFGNSPPIASRTGWMSLACLPFIIATSSKSNMITGLTGVSHEKLQVFHRWISYACFVLALIHTFPFIVFRTWRGDLNTQATTTIYYWTGIIALISQAWLTFASASPLRNWCYEFFKFSHFAAALIFVVFFFLHCNFRLSSWDYFIVTAVIFTLTWLHSQLRIYFQHGIQKATIVLESNGFVKVTIPTQTTWRAGQHYFIRFLGMGSSALTTHPFSASSLPAKAHYYEAAQSELVFYIRPQGGFTARLAKYAEKHSGSKMSVTLDGPYGGIDMPKLASCKKTLALAGGSGAGWLLPLVEAFLRRRDCVSAGCDPETGKMGAICGGEGPELRVVLATRDIATRNWFEEAVSELLSSSMLGCCPSGLNVEIYFTGSEDNVQHPKETGQFLQTLDEPEKVPDAKIAQHNKSESSDSDSEKKVGSLLSPKDHSSRPDLPAIITEEAEVDASSMGVFCCGPLSMQSDVANAVAAEQLKGIKDGNRNVYLHMEHFSWA
ncbi:Putative ferric reductase, NAD binding domain, ferric reductase transmembrane component-like protein [Septoria linicola]|uniref:ferric-chelate reductase (NADPH) n=1 Tax=Septoria linicola TaxID=215465 RepID=A0A9Q9AZI7_9PEZI|nr:Putative ferric reductase, NAD binding domain, ferric reductase transmembrane component-like protein [Septoria linicola]